VLVFELDGRIVDELHYGEVVHDDVAVVGRARDCLYNSNHKTIRYVKIKKYFFFFFLISFTWPMPSSIIFVLRYSRQHILQY
jgi:hypothetical protein